MSQGLKIFIFCSLLVITTVGIARATYDFTLSSLNNQSVSLHDFLGRKIIVMNFWASWCDTCEEEMPQLLKLKEKYASDPDVVFFGINAGDSPRAAQKFVDKLNYSYNILMDVDKQVSK
ncbi:MAG: peroxiredoxin-like protein, partial [uncultured bacterium]